MKAIEGRNPDSSIVPIGVHLSQRPLAGQLSPLLQNLSSVKCAWLCSRMPLSIKLSEHLPCIQVWAVMADASSARQPCPRCHKSLRRAFQLGSSGWPASSHRRFSSLSCNGFVLRTQTGHTQLITNCRDLLLPQALCLSTLQF